MSVFNQSRSYIIRLIFIGLFLVMLVQLFNLQVLSDKYQELAQDNAINKKIIYPPRGLVYDRNGKPIVNNKLAYDLMVRPSDIKGADTTYLCELLEIDQKEFIKRIENARFKGGNLPSAFESLLTPEKVARLQENLWRVGNGFFLQERPIRMYPFNAGGHFVGYIGEVDSAIIAKSEGFYRRGDYVGRSGLEAYYEKVLMGQRGVEYWIRDKNNRLVGRFDEGKQDVKAVAGRALKTYVDIELQQLAEKLMQNKMGAVVALEPQTGGIIAMVSGPNFTPDALTGYNFKKNYSKFVLDVSKPLLNRAIKGQYPPGSTYKPIGGLVALDEGVITPRFSYPCSGRYYACGHGKPACTHNNAGHAGNLRLAIANSCNAYFAHVYRLSVDNPKIGNVKDGYQKWKEYMNNFGLGVRLGVDLPSEDKGSIPDSSVYNKAYRNSWNSCTNLTLGIGQDMMTSTPLQLANAMCLIANKGYYYTPHFVKEIEGETKEDTILNKFRQKHDPLTQVSDTAFEAIIAGMQDVVEIGTARSAKIPGINVCAKTGTAENYKIMDGKRIKLKDNSVFVCFAPRENPKIAIAVVVENAGYGGTWAGPISALLMEKYLNDTLRPERVKEVERIAAANLMPGWLVREQFREDSIRARYWFNLTKDSNYLRKYIYRTPAAQPKKDTSNKQKPPVRVAFNKIDLITPEKNYFITRKRGNA